MERMYERIGTKTEEQMFLNRLNSGFNLPPITSEAILSLTKSIFREDGDNRVLRAGQMKIYAVCKKEPPGKPIKNCEMIPVVITVDAKEDIDVYEKHGMAAYRQHVICRVTDESAEQGGLLSIEDLVRILKSSVRTIKRDIAVLRCKGINVRIRGYVKDIGRGVSHKTKIVELWIKRYTYTEIERHMRHSLDSIKEYITKFGKVLILKEMDYPMTDIRFIVGVSETLLNEYIDLYEKYNVPEYRERIDELVSMVHNTGDEFKKKGVMRK